jgi:HPt (histidine-containing phosphotransfer) domain-containing protein
MIPGQQTRACPALDQATLLESVGGDAEFLDEVIGLFLAACPTLLNQIRAALAHHDFDALQRPARILAGALRSFPVEQAQRAASALEWAAYRRQTAEADAAFHALELEIKSVSYTLSGVAAEALNPARQ